MLKITFLSIATVLSLGASIWAGDNFDFVDICENAVRIRKEKHKSDAYVNVPANSTEEYLGKSLEALQRIFGDELQMRLYDSHRVQIFWDHMPHRNTPEFLNNSFINTLDPRLFKDIHDCLLPK